MRVHIDCSNAFSFVLLSLCCCATRISHNMKHTLILRWSAQHYRPLLTKFGFSRFIKASKIKFHGNAPCGCRVDTCGRTRRLKLISYIIIISNTMFFQYLTSPIKIPIWRLPYPYKHSDFVKWLLHDVQLKVEQKTTNPLVGCALTTPFYAVDCMTSLLITEDVAHFVVLSTAQSCVKNHCSHCIAGALSINHRQYICYYCYTFSSHIRAASVFILF